MTNLKKAIVPLIIVTLLVAAAFTMFNGDDRKHLTASFPRTVSLYEGSDVRVLGVPVGKVDSVTPTGTSVKVEMSYDAEVDIPADAQALIVSPSIVGDRFVQLTPVYEGGRTLADGATLDASKTSTPLELDEIYQSLDDLTVALGPDGANKEGALSELLTTTADNFGGQGAQLNQTIKDLGKFTGTLDNNKEELFGTAKQLEAFISTLAENDKTVRNFNTSLGDASELLAGEREELSASLRNLSIALGEVRTFVKDNRKLLGRNIKGLNRVSKILVKQRAALDSVLKDAPLALNNLAFTYNPQAGTLDTRANLDETLNQVVSDPSLVLCGILNQADKSGSTCDLIKDALPRPGTFGDGKSQAPRERFDPSLAGLVEVPQ